MTVHCLSSGCLNETPETGRLVHFLTVLEVKSLKSRWQHGCFQARMTFWLLEATFQVCALCSSLGSSSSGTCGLTSQPCPLGQHQASGGSVPDHLSGHHVLSPASLPGRPGSLRCPVFSSTVCIAGGIIFHEGKFTHATLPKRQKTTL